MKRLLHRAALRFERIVDRFGRKQDLTRVIDPYAGYATSDQLIIRGRVLTASTRQTPGANARKLSNFRQMLALFLTNEVADVRVTTGETEAITDEEGYFILTLPRPTESGWIEIPVIVDSADNTQPPVLCPAFVPDASAEFMVASDIDDTVMETGAFSLIRNLWTSMTGNALTRHIYPDAVALLSDLSAQNRNPIFYVSSSPWNLHGFLSEIFDRNNLVRGPMFLRDLGLSETKFITDRHGNHKGGSIDLLMRAQPDLPVILLGDTGQHDSVIYAEAVKTHPGRVAAVVLRETSNGSDDHDLAPIREMEQAGVPVFHNRQFPTAAQLRDAIAR